MFRTVVPSIIRSSKLHIRQQAYVKQLLLPAGSGEEMERSSISSPLAAGSSSCFTYACCRMCSFELLMMDGTTVRNVQSFWQEQIFWETGVTCWLYYKNILGCTDLWTPKVTSLSRSQSHHVGLRYRTMDKRLERLRPLGTSCAALCAGISHGWCVINSLCSLSWKLNKEFQVEVSTCFRIA